MFAFVGGVRDGTCSLKPGRQVLDKRSSLDLMLDSSASKAIPVIPTTFDVLSCAQITFYFDILLRRANNLFPNEVQALPAHTHTPAGGALPMLK